MAIATNPYLIFPDNNCRQAMECYGAIFGATPQIMSYDTATQNPADADKVMHAELRAPEIFLQGCDNCDNSDLVTGNTFTVAIMGSEPADEPRIREIFTALSDGATITQELAAMPWGGVYGSLVDKFGIQWAVNVPNGEAPQW